MAKESDENQKPETLQSAKSTPKRDNKLPDDKHMAETMLNGFTASAGIVGKFALEERVFNLADFTDVLRERAEKVNNGDFRQIEAMLTSQSSALDIIFVTLAFRAKANMGKNLDAADRFMRLALKAQGQCRATLETLANIKNPPVVVARQANIAHGPQQVNNNFNTAAGKNFCSSTHAHAGAGNSSSVQNELLEQRHDEHLDIGMPGAAVASDPAMATVGKIDRPPHG